MPRAKKTTTKKATKPKAVKKVEKVEENPYPNDVIPPIKLKNGKWLRFRQPTQDTQ